METRCSSMPKALSKPNVAATVTVEWQPPKPELRGRGRKQDGDENHRGDGDAELAYEVFRRAEPPLWADPQPCRSSGRAEEVGAGCPERCGARCRNRLMLWPSCISDGKQDCASPRERAYCVGSLYMRWTWVRSPITPAACSSVSRRPSRVGAVPQSETRQWFQSGVFRVLSELTRHRGPCCGPGSASHDLIRG